MIEVVKEKPCTECGIKGLYEKCEDKCVQYRKWYQYQQGRADSEKEDLIKACIKQLKESDADEVKVSADTKDGYKVTVIVELKEQKE